jgi:hypothetical protein
MHDYVGRCACGRTELHLLSGLDASQFQPRSDAATCAFCSEHDGVWISDPGGTLRLRSSDQTRIETFASGQVKFNFCPGCDSLLYATFEDVAAGRSVAVVRLALFETIRAAAPRAMTTTFEGETLARGQQRRLENWTPVRRS